MPGVSWAAVFAGAVASLALTLVLLSFGAGMGFSVVSPWGNSGFSATTYLGSALAVGTFKASDVAQMINENGTTPDGVAVRECLFPGGKGDQAVSNKSVGKRLGAYVGNPVMHGERTLTLCGGTDSRSKTQTFFVKAVAA